MNDNITDWVLEEYQSFYKDNSITKEDVFYYTYGILHSRGYRQKYQKILVKQIPNIPMSPDFWIFRKAGYELGQLHMNYETCQRYDLGEPINKIPDFPKKINFERITNSKGKKIFNHKSVIIDGKKIYDNLPLVKYKVNGRTPIQWFENNYGFSTNGESEITNYPLENVTSEEVHVIIERLVYVGVESDRIMEKISKEPFESPNAPKYNQGDKPTLTRFLK